MYHELYGAGTSYFITNSDVATPYSTSTTINYNYGNSNSTYIFMCANIKGGDRNNSLRSDNASKTLFGFTTPKKFYVKYRNSDPVRDIDTLFKTGGTNDTPQFANNTHSI